MDILNLTQQLYLFVSLDVEVLVSVIRFVFLRFSFESYQVVFFDEALCGQLGRVEVHHLVLDHVVVLVLDEDCLVHHLFHVVQPLLFGAPGVLVDVVSVTVLDL